MILRANIKLGNSGLTMEEFIFKVAHRWTIPASKFKHVGTLEEINERSQIVLVEKTKENAYLARVSPQAYSQQEKRIIGCTGCGCYDSTNWRVLSLAVSNDSIQPMDLTAEDLKKMDVYVIL